MFPSKTSIGMEVSHNGVGAILPRMADGRITPERSQWQPLPPTTLRHSFREPQVLQPAAFIKAVGEAWGGLHLSRRRISLSLPDSAGRLMLSSLDEPGKNRNETMEMLRWKLARRLAITPEELHLDFRIIRRHEGGSCDVIAAVMFRSVIKQYEELLIEAGLQPCQISFHSLNLMRLFDHYHAGEGLLVLLYDDSLTMVAQSEGSPLFFRTKRLPFDSPPAVIRRELSGTLSACRDACSGVIPGSTFALLPPHNDYLLELVFKIYGEEICQLVPDQTRDPSSTTATHPPSMLHQLSAATGAALGGNACHMF